MLAVGVVEILRPSIGAYVVAGWLLGIIVNLRREESGSKRLDHTVGLASLARLHADVRLCWLTRNVHRYNDHRTVRMTHDLSCCRT